MLRTRIITATLLIIGFLSALFLVSHQVWALLTLAIALLGVTEWADLIRLNKAQKLLLLAVAFSVGLWILLLSITPLAQYQYQLMLSLLGLTTFFWVFIAPVWLLTRKVISSRLALSSIGVLLLLAMWVGVVGLRSISPWLLLAVIATVCIADSAAYFAGKRFGRHKLAPEISPGKTWEGVAGAMLAVSVYGAALCYFYQYNLWLIVGLYLTVVLSIMGDLFESLLKRQAGLKDSGQLLPGHGGVLDRIDGLIPTLPITLFCLSFILMGLAHA